ncbi:MAG: hypothetical protein HUU60_03930 [Armatimonadetes bacterium]|nr:hypothetical protein [Armatimonadota bacterium]
MKEQTANLVKEARTTKKVWRRISGCKKFDAAVWEVLAVRALNEADLGLAQSLQRAAYRTPLRDARIRLDEFVDRATGAEGRRL